jgi:hypothetical protein
MQSKLEVRELLQHPQQRNLVKAIIMIVEVEQAECKFCFILVINHAKKVADGET